MSARAVALLLAAACPGLARSQAQLASASRVCVLNNGSIDLSFELWDTAGNSLSSTSDSLTSGEQSCLELSSIDGIEPGNPVVAVVKAKTGCDVSHSMPPLLYSPASSDMVATANFSCVGTAENISCYLDGEAVTMQPGTLHGVPASEQARASKICVQNSGDFSMTARLFNTATGAFGDWSPSFWTVRCRGCRGPAGVPSLALNGVACFDGSSLPGLASGHPLVVVANPEGAKPGPSLVRSILYDPDVTTPVLVECWGFKLSYSCVFRGAQQGPRRLRGSSAAAPAPVLV